MIAAWVSTIITVCLVTIMVVQIIRVEIKAARSRKEIDAYVRAICADDRTPPPRVVELRQRNTGSMKR